MTKYLYYSLLVSIFLTLTGCVTILSPKNQKVAMQTTRGQKIATVDGKKPQTSKNGKYLIKKDRKPKEIIVTRKGYKDKRVIAYQSRRSPYVLFSTIFIVWDKGARAYEYPRKMNIPKNRKVLEDRKKEEKEIYLNKVSLSLDEGDLLYSFTTWRNFMRKGIHDSETKEVDLKDEIKITNTIFQESLNEILSEKGYIDTSRKVLKNSFTNNLILNADIEKVVVHSVGKMFYYTNMTYTGASQIELDVNWEVLDTYGNVVYDKRVNSISDANIVEDLSASFENSEEGLKEALEENLFKLLTNKSVKKLLVDRSDETAEAGFEFINIKKPNKYVSNIKDAMKASVTILNGDDSHGSGFLISNDGYLITNYHVIAQEKELSIHMNDGTTYTDVKIIRSSKLSDLALLKIDLKTPIAPFKINKSKDIEIAENIFAIGTPAASDLSQTLSKGIISGIRKTDGGGKLIQTDASVNAGNSGGPLINKDGLLLGIVNAKLSGIGVEGIGFAIPSYELFDKLKIQIK